MGIAAGILTGYSLMSILLWATDTVIIWVIGFIGFAICFPLAVSSWIAFFVEMHRKKTGKPKGNTAIIFVVVTSLCLAAAVSIGIVAFINEGTAKSYGYGIITLFIASPILFIETFVTVVVMIVNASRIKTQRINSMNNAQYPNMQYPNMQYQNMQYPNMPYGNVPYNNYPNANYPNQNGYYQNPNGYYPDNNYPYNNYQGGNFPNNNYRQ